MRITKDTLLNLAKDAVEERVKTNKQIVAAYLHGSLIGDDALLGEVTDIDLTFVYRRGFAPEPAREFVQLASDIHLDIQHHDEADYKPPRALRVQPWLGNDVYDFLILHDPRHVLDFVQAGVRNSFFEAEVVVERAEFFTQAARTLWSEHSQKGTELVFDCSRYFTALENADNAIVSLNGPPLPLRRMVATLPERMADFNDDGLLVGFLGLAGLTNLEEIDLDAALLAWQDVYPVAAQENADMPLFRQAYYRNAIQHWLDAGNKAAAVWILLNTWMKAVLSVDGEDSLKYKAPLEQFLGTLGFTRESLSERWAGLDLYLDNIEELFENWKAAKGI